MKKQIVNESFVKISVTLAAKDLLNIYVYHITII